MDIVDASTSVTDELKTVVSTDLARKLAEYKDPKKGLRMMAREMGIHLKTLRRLINGENKAGYLTLYKIYRVIYSTNSDSEIMQLVPKIVAEEIKKCNPKKLSKEVHFSTNIGCELRRDSVIAEIYFLAAVEPITREMISFRFGTHGGDRLNEMIKNQMLEVLESGRIALGKNRANFSAELIKEIGLHLSSKYTKPENSDEKGENYLSLYGNLVTPEVYNEWLKIDEEAYQKKVELCKNSKDQGTIKAFTFATTDTLTERI